MDNTTTALRKTLENQLEALDKIEELTTLFDHNTTRGFNTTPHSIAARKGHGHDPTKTIAPIAEKIQINGRELKTWSNMSSIDLDHTFPVTLSVTTTIPWTKYLHEPGTMSKEGGYEPCHRCGHEGGHPCPREQKTTISTVFYSFYPREYIHEVARDELITLIEDLLNPELKEEAMELVEFLDECVEARKERIHSLAADTQKKAEKLNKLIEEEA